MDHKTVVVSSTRGWNVGDEIIFAGIKNLIGNDSINWVLFDRNPDIRMQRGRVLSNVFSDQKSFKCDAILLAGTPEWSGDACTPLYKLADRLKCPVYILGVGCGTNSFSDLERRVLMNQGKWRITRDFDTGSVLPGGNAVTLPCPALFADQSFKNTRKVKRIGITMQMLQKGCHGLGTMYTEADLYQLVDDFKRLYDVSIICHYIKEFEFWSNLMPKLDVYYSYDVNTYLKFYREFDAIVGTRLHGACLALAQGKPTVLINKSHRCVLAQKPFGDLMPLCDIKETKDVFCKINNIEHRDAIFKFISEIRHKYMSILNKDIL